jgi:SAM-dependent methyltransferase
MTSLTLARTRSELLEVNRDVYNNSWPLVLSLLTSNAGWRWRRGCVRALSLAAAPAGRGYAIHRYQSVGAGEAARARATGALGSISALPCGDAVFELICAFDVIEHVDNDERALAELARVAAPGAALLTPVPLHPKQWTSFRASTISSATAAVTSRQNWSPSSRATASSVERSTAFGMKPKASRLVDLGMWFLIHRRELAMWSYNRVFVPLGVRFQKPLAVTEGMIDTLPRSARSCCCAGAAALEAPRRRRQRTTMSPVVAGRAQLTRRGALASNSRRSTVCQSMFRKKASMYLSRSVAW